MSIDARTSIGRVVLRVGDLARSLTFYERVLGFRVLGRELDRAMLGASTEPLVELIGTPGAVPKPRHATGLYHFAILVPGRQELSRALARLVHARWPGPGASDHGVSEALYISDPDGNGIEIYRDRPRAEWPVRGGRLEMVIDSLDLRTLLQEAAGDGPGRPLDPATRIGHVHLHVRDLAEAERFYHGILGFDVMQKMQPSALFVSAGGYHHHLGLNTWAGVGAPPAPAGSAGLEYYEVTLPDAAAMVSVREALAGAGVGGEERAGGWLVRDPSGNGVAFTTAEGH